MASFKKKKKNPSRQYIEFLQINTKQTQISNTKLIVKPVSEKQYYGDQMSWQWQNIRW